MFKNYFKGMDGIETYPIISLLVFFIFFLVVLVWLLRTDKNQLKELSQLPFHDNSVDDPSDPMISR